MSHFWMILLQILLNSVHLSSKTIHHLLPMLQQKCLQLLFSFHQFNLLQYCWQVLSSNICENIDLVHFSTQLT